MLQKTLLTFIFASLTSQIILHPRIQEAHDKFNESYENHMRSALSHVNEEFKNFDYKIKDFELQFNWSHGNIPTNQIKFGIFSSEDDQVCTFDFKVEAFQDHLNEMLEDSDKNKKFHEQATECSANIRKFQLGPSDKVEELVTEIKEINQELSNPHDAQTLDILKNEFYKVINEAGETAFDALKILQEEQDEEEEKKDEIVEKKLEEEKDLNEEVWNEIKPLFESDEEEFVDENSYIKLNDQLKNNEIEIIGIEPKLKDAIKTRVEEQVDLIKTGVRKPTKLDDETYERIAKLFESEEKESEEKESEEKKSEDENLNSVDESSESEEEPYKNKTEKSENRPLKFILNPYFSMPQYNHNFILSLLKPKEENLALVPYQGNNFQKKLQEQLSNIRTIENIKPVGAEKACSLIHRDILRSYMKQMKILNLLQNIQVFDENIVECKFLGDNQDRTDAILQFNGERCYLSVTYSKPQNSSEVYSILSSSQADKVFSLHKEKTHNCLHRMGTDLALAKFK